MVRLDLKRNCNDRKRFVRSVKVKVVDKYDVLIDGNKRGGGGAGDVGHREGCCQN